MPITPISVPDFPNVPDFPGVPPLVRSALVTSVAPKLVRLTTDVNIVKSLLGISGTPQWGLFDQAGKSQLVVPDNVYSVGLSGDNKITDAPLETGAFQSYNKVTLPKEVELVLTKGGTVSDRQTFLQTCVNLRSSLTLCTVVMPEAVVKNMNVVGLRLDRSAESGLQLLSVTLHLREVRLAPVAAFSNTKDPNASAQQNGGQVQPQAPNAAQTAQLTPAS